MSKEEKRGKKMKEEVKDEQAACGCGCSPAEEVMYGCGDGSCDASKGEQCLPEVDEFTKLQDQCAEYLDKWQRLGAEFDNFRKRTATEKASMYDNGAKDAFLAVLPVLDNLERAVAAVNAEEYADDALYKGLTQILRQFAGALESSGICEIDALNKPFDPNLHAAVQHEENEAFEANTVSEVLMKGYTHKEKVIRHSMVKVAN